MDELSVAWGYSSNTSGIRFWSINADGRYTVGFYTPTTFMIERSEGNIPEGAFTKGLPSPGPIKPSKSDDAHYNFQIRSFSKNLAERVPIRKEIMTSSQVIQLRNKDLADKLNMSSYVKRVASFVGETGERDEYIHTGQPVRILAEAGFFHHSQNMTDGLSLPQLICFACGFETREMRQDPIGDHLRYEESAYSLKFGCGLRHKVRKEMTVSLLSVNRPDSPTIPHPRSLRGTSHDDEQWQDIMHRQPETGEEENSRVEDEMEEEMMRGWVLDEAEDIEELLSR